MVDETQAALLVAIAAAVGAAYALGAVQQRYRTARDNHVDARGKLRRARRTRLYAGAAATRGWAWGAAGLIVVAAWLTGRSLG